MNRSSSILTKLSQTGGCAEADSNNADNRYGMDAEYEDLKPKEALSLFELLHETGLKKGSLPKEFNAKTIIRVLHASNGKLHKDDNCVTLKSPVLLFGVIHAQYHQMTKLINLAGLPPKIDDAKAASPDKNFLFLGDYVNRGPHSIATILYLLLLHLTHAGVYVLRGNHEDSTVFMNFELPKELTKNFSDSQAKTLMLKFEENFRMLSICAIIDGDIFCCHGGLSPEFLLNKFSNQRELVKKINSKQKPIYNGFDDYVTDLLWADAMNYKEKYLEDWSSTDISKCSVESIWKARENEYTDENITYREVLFIPNKNRHCSYQFSEKAFNIFLKRFSFKYFIRANMFEPTGYKYKFGDRLINIFSASNIFRPEKSPGAVLYICAKNNRRSQRGKFGKVITYREENLLNFYQDLPTELDYWPNELG